MKLAVIFADRMTALQVPLLSSSMVEDGHWVWNQADHSMWPLVSGLICVSCNDGSFVKMM